MIRLLLFGAVLFAGSVGAFFLYIPFLPTVAVAVILLGLALMFLIGANVGGNHVLRRRLIELRARRLRLRRNAQGDDVKAPPALTAALDE